MIWKNQTVGTITGITCIELGDGNVFINSCDIDGVKSLTFRNGEKMKVGNKLSDKGDPYVGIDVMLSFKNIESLDVLQEAITKLRNELKSE